MLSYPKEQCRIHITVFKNFLSLQNIFKSLKDQYVFKLMMGWSRESKLKEVEKDQTASKTCCSSHLLRGYTTSCFSQILPKWWTFYTLGNIDKTQLNPVVNRKVPLVP